MSRGGDTRQMLSSVMAGWRSSSRLELRRPRIFWTRVCGASVSERKVRCQRRFKTELNRPGFRVQVKTVVNDNRREDNEAATARLCGSLVEAGAVRGRRVRGERV